MTTGHISFPTTSATILYASTVIYANEAAVAAADPTNISHYESPTAPQSRLLSKGEAYLYGTLAVLIVSLLSLTGAAILPILDKKLAYRASMLLFMALAVGTMTSDAFLHMIPECLGLHSHSHEHRNENDHENHDHEHDHLDDPNHNERNHLPFLIIILLSIYALYLLEIISIMIAKYFKFSHSHGSHSHFGHGGMHANFETQPPKQDTEMASVKNSTISQKSTSVETDGRKSSHDHHQERAVLTGKELICGLKPVAFVVLFGDALHNFCDGLAMGAAFVTSASSGLSTTIAVICHELPHEVGDFAILLNSNMSVKNALFFNFLSALTAFAGLYVGIEAGQLESMRKWIFSLVAGGFLYISLVHILNEIKECSENMHWLLSIFLQNMGFIIGFVIVFLLALYE